MAQNQNPTASQSVKMDSRKFLGALNDSAQARITYFEDKIASMGQHAGKNYRLVALHAKNLYFEDIDANNFYVADHIRDKGNKGSKFCVLRSHMGACLNPLWLSLNWCLGIPSFNSKQLASIWINAHWDNLSKTGVNSLIKVGITSSTVIDRSSSFAKDVTCAPAMPQGIILE